MKNIERKRMTKRRKRAHALLNTYTIVIVAAVYYSNNVNAFTNSFMQTNLISYHGGPINNFNCNGCIKMKEVNDEDEAEREFFEDYKRYTEQKIAEVITGKSQSIEVSNRNYNQWKLLDWQMRCGLRYRAQRIGSRGRDNDTKSSSQHLWQQNFIQLSKERTRHSALCIVPGEDTGAWDTIQRFRFTCRDNRLYYFPPSINLFYPFTPTEALSSAASATGNLLQLMPSKIASCFEISFDRVVLIVSRDSLEIHPDVSAHKEKSVKRKDLEATKKKEVYDLIKNEEMKGRDRRIKRLLREKEEMISSGKSVPKEFDVELTELLEMKINNTDLNSNEDYPDEENDMHSFVENSNSKIHSSPCLLCLAPDQNSSERVKSLRQILANEMFGCYDRPSGIFKNGAILNLDFSLDENIPGNFSPFPSIKNEPVMIIGQFRSALKASQIGQIIDDEVKRSGSIGFNVQDLHFISNDDKETKSKKDKKSENDPTIARKTFGVDAKVSLVNIEEEIDLEALDDPSENDELNFDEIFSSLLEIAEAEAKQALMIWSREEREQLGIDEELHLDFLDESIEDWNEGATITIGRAQFFIGDKRDYTGMPATNPMDRKRELGNDFMSGATRRKGARHGALRWNDGDYGQKDGDLA